MNGNKTKCGFEVEKVNRLDYVVFKLTKHLPDGTCKGFHVFVHEFGTFGGKFVYGVGKHGYWEYGEPLSHEMLLKVVRIVTK